MQYASQLHINVQKCGLLTPQEQSKQLIYKGFGADRGNRTPRMQLGKLPFYH